MISTKTDVNKYLNHAMSDPLVKFYMSNSGSKQLLSLPICPKCERLGLRDKGWALYQNMTCPYCGFRGHATHQLSAYLDEGQYN